MILGAESTRDLFLEAITLMVARRDVVLLIKPKVMAPAVEAAGRLTPVEGDVVLAGLVGLT